MDKQILALVTELRHELHAHAELSMHEVWTKKRLMDFLRTHTNLELFEQERWFYAFYRCEGATKTIGIRADFDALPIEERLPDLPYRSIHEGISHKCGHDGHAATLAGLAMEIDREGCDKNVVFLFQHAEETGEGAVECVDTLVKAGVDEFYAFHNMPGYPKNSVIVRAGVMQCASTGMTVTMHGTPTHASTPELGKNPAHAIASLACALRDLASASQYDGMVLCTVIQIDVGQKAFGTSASEGEISMTVRAEQEKEMDLLIKRIEDKALELSRKEGLACEITYTERFAETRNNDVLVAKLRDAAEKRGLPLVEMEKPLRGSEDFGVILKAIPGVAFEIGNGEGYPGLHSYEYDFPDDIIETAVEVYRAILSCP